MSGYHSREMMEVVGISLCNICLLVTAAFYRRSATMGSISVPRAKLGYIATSLGLCSQVLYCLMLAVWRYGWVPLPPDPGVNSLFHLEVNLSNLGSVLSLLAVMAALVSTGFQRFVGVFAGSITFYLWGLVGLEVAFSKLFR